MGKSKHSVPVAMMILSWLSDMHAPDLGDTLESADPPATPERRIGWLREVDSGQRGVGFLPIDTSRPEPYQLEHAGIIEGDGTACGPAYLKVSAKGETRLQCHPRYRLSALGRRWVAFAYTQQPQPVRALVAAMLGESMERPDDVAALTSRVRPVVGIATADHARWAALVLVGAGLRALAADELIGKTLDEHKTIIADPLT